MATDTIYLIGGGGHGKVVAEALLAGGVSGTRIVVRDRSAGLTMLRKPVITPEIDPTMAGGFFHVAIGSAAVRARLFAAAEALGAEPVSVVHPAAILARDAGIDSGTLVAAGAVVAPGASIGRGTIVNHGAIVDHDVTVGDFCHIAPQAALGGEAVLADRVIIGAGAVVLPGVAIVSDVTVGAGAVVLRSILEPGTWIGNPARRLES